MLVKGATAHISVTHKMAITALRENGQYSADNIFKCILLNDIFTKPTLKFIRLELSLIWPFCLVSFLWVLHDIATNIDLWFYFTLSNLDICNTMNYCIDFRWNHDVDNYRKPSCYIRWLYQGLSARLPWQWSDCSLTLSHRYDAGL